MGATLNVDHDIHASQRQTLNRVRYVEGTGKGHYESYFLRANHPTKPLAFWFRYTIFSPKAGSVGNGDEPLGELWAMVFDKEKNQITAAKEELSINQCSFSSSGLDVSIADIGLLRPGVAQGRASSGGNTISWDLVYGGGQQPLKLLPDNMYDGAFPKAKALVANPMVSFTGTIAVNDEVLTVDRWVGSENHNWGSQHTDRYAWGQVAGFDNDPDAFLELGTAKVKVGPLHTPWITTLVMRYDDREIAINGILQALKAKASYRYFHWEFETRTNNVRVKGQIYGPKENFVGLNYYNPPGDSNTCLNSKIASCRLIVQEVGKPERVFETQHRAAFEILTGDKNHGIRVVA
ncbi:hypothetical protein A9Q99_18380 [Gammaproteobacteria bacterium 45_16_T64]|nr:hypothetical protein A9Q99_18380 [Gammaproteobacteria bacterium 45_16_T64]